jgi:pimeloyl-ACP methyl ester carboxylesterase
MEKTMEAVQKFARIQDLEISYYQSGEKGKPVILLHGGGMDSAMLSWREVLPVLGDHFRIFAPDWPGYGDSQELSRPYALDRLKSILKGLVDHWGVERASLVGLSMGGGAALGFTLAFPQQVEKLVLVDSYGLRKKASNHPLSYFNVQVPLTRRLMWRGIRKDKGLIRAVLRNIFANPDRITDRIVDEIFAAVQNPAGERAFYAYQKHEMTWKGFRNCFVDRLPEIHQPTLFVHGEKNSLAPIEMIQQAVERMPDAKLAAMPDTGQWAPREYPEEFSQLVIDFLTGEEDADQ